MANYKHYIIAFACAATAILAAPYAKAQSTQAAIAGIAAQIQSLATIVTALGNQAKQAGQNHDELVVIANEQIANIATQNQHLADIVAQLAAQTAELQAQSTAQATALANLSSSSGGGTNFQITCAGTGPSTFIKCYVINAQTGAIVSNFRSSSTSN